MATVNIIFFTTIVALGERIYKGQIFKKSQHHQRLHESAAMLGFKIPYSVAELHTERLKMF